MDSLVAGSDSNVIRAHLHDPVLQSVTACSKLCLNLSLAALGRCVHSLLSHTAATPRAVTEPDDGDNAAPPERDVGLVAQHTIDLDNKPPDH